MRKFFGIIFLLAAGYLAFETVRSMGYAIEDGFQTRNMSEPAPGVFGIMFLIFGIIVFVLAWIGVKLLRKPVQTSSNAIDDDLIEKDLR